MAGSPGRGESNGKDSVGAILLARDMVARTTPRDVTILIRSGRATAPPPCKDPVMRHFRRPLLASDARTLENAAHAAAGGGLAGSLGRRAPACPDRYQSVRAANLHDRTTGHACLSGLWLWFDFLDESHSLSQDIHTVEGSFWHGIMHRREGDFANAKYWFRPRPPAHGLLGRWRRRRPDWPAASRGRPRGSRRPWDADAFIDLVEECVTGRSGLTTLCESLQKREWELLLRPLLPAGVGVVARHRSRSDWIECRRPLWPRRGSNPSRPRRTVSLTPSADGPSPATAPRGAALTAEDQTVQILGPQVRRQGEQFPVREPAPAAVMDVGPAQEMLHLCQPLRVEL